VHFCNSWADWGGVKNFTLMNSGGAFWGGMGQHYFRACAPLFYPILSGIGQKGAKLFGAKWGGIIYHSSGFQNLFI